MKKILYIGGFEMPDGNAAAQRVLAIAKSLKGHYNISFLGITHKDNTSGEVDGFKFINLPYPSSKKEWFNHLNGSNELNYIKTIHPDIVISYNFPALGLKRVIKYCKKEGIKTIGDITEWYHPHNFIKWIDTEWRMKSLNKQMDGLIVISHYLDDYYNQCVKTFRLPPTVDASEEKWRRTQSNDSDANVISLMYAGSPGRGDKDRMDELVDCLGDYTNFSLDVVGINEVAFRKQFPEVKIPQNVKFWGRQSHEKTIEMLCNCDFSIFFRQPSRVNNAGFPTKFAEAQSAGIPVISSHFSDLEDYVEEGKNGFLADDITSDDIKRVLSKVSQLSRADIQVMREYTQSLNKFDYRNYQETLIDFVSTI